MKRILILCLCLMCCGGGGPDPSAPVAAVENEPAQIVVCFGTSLTDMGYAPMLQSHEEDLNISVINMGFRGFNSYMLYAKHLDEVVALAPDIVIYESAINDAYAQTTPYWMDVSVGNIIKELQSTGARVIVLTTNPSTVDRPDLTQYYEDIKSLAWKYGAEVVDLYPLWTKEDMKYIPDGVHPTLEGLEKVTYKTLSGVF